MGKVKERMAHKYPPTYGIGNEEAKDKLAQITEQRRLELDHKNRNKTQKEVQRARANAPRQDILTPQEKEQMQSLSGTTGIESGYMVVEDMEEVVRERQERLESDMLAESAGQARASTPGSQESEIDDMDPASYDPPTPPMSPIISSMLEKSPPGRRDASPTVLSTHFPGAEVAVQYGVAGTSSAGLKYQQYKAMKKRTKAERRDLAAQGTVEERKYKAYLMECGEGRIKVNPKGVPISPVLPPGATEEAGEEAEGEEVDEGGELATVKWTMVVRCGVETSDEVQEGESEERGLPPEAPTSTAEALARKEETKNNLAAAVSDVVGLLECGVAVAGLREAGMQWKQIIRKDDLFVTLEACGEVSRLGAIERTAPGLEGTRVGWFRVIKVHPVTVEAKPCTEASPPDQLTEGEGPERTPPEPQSVCCVVS